MNYGKRLLERVRGEKSGVLNASGQQKHQFVEHHEKHLRFQCRVKQVDPGGVEVEYVSVSRINEVQDVEEMNRRLEGQAEAIQKQITFLLEDFRLIEIDHRNKRAQLRSYPPYSDDDSKYYYEIMLEEGNQVHFQRYQYSMSNKRFQKITSQFSTEAFQRLVTELAKAMQ